MNVFDGNHLTCLVPVPSSTYLVLSTMSSRVPFTSSWTNNNITEGKKGRNTTLWLHHPSLGGPLCTFVSTVVVRPVQTLVNRFA